MTYAKILEPYPDPNLMYSTTLRAALYRYCLLLILHHTVRYMYSIYSTYNPCLWLGGDLGIPVLRRAMEKKGGLLNREEAVEAMQQKTAA